MQELSYMTGNVHLIAGIVCVVSLIISGSLIIGSYYCYSKVNTNTEKHFGDISQRSQKEAQKESQEEPLNVGKHSLETANIRCVAQQGVHQRYINSYKEDTSKVDMNMIVIIICAIILIAGAIWNFGEYFNMF